MDALAINLTLSIHTDIYIYIFHDTMLFHNLKNYDSHLIIVKKADELNDKLNKNKKIGIVQSCNVFV